MEKRPMGRSAGRLGSRGALPRTPGVTASDEGRGRPGVSQVEKVQVRDVEGMVRSRQLVRERALSLGFSVSEACVLAAVASELARNILQYAEEGVFTTAVITAGAYQGILLVADDQGPGIPSIKHAMEPGWSTSGGLGMGLAGVAKIMDELEVDSAPGRGTRVRATLWRRKPGET